MRKALIGLSSPTAYFYDSQQKYFKEEWRWNPILESPQGLITLFDELWFVTRSLCPVSLRKQEYVKFIDEDSTYSSNLFEILREFADNNFEVFLEKYFYLEDFIDFSSMYGSQFGKYTEVVQSVFGQKPSAKLPIDNHSHSLGIPGFEFSGNSMRTDLFALDNVILDYLSIPNMELITNQFNNHLMKLKPKNALNEIRISQGITIKRIPVVQLPNGPDLIGLLKLRESNDLIDFRKKILTSNVSEEFEDIVKNVENEFQNFRNNVLLKKISDSKIKNSLSRNALNYIIGKVVPAYGQIKSIGEDSNTREMNWTGFIANLDKKIP